MTRNGVKGTSLAFCGVFVAMTIVAQPAQGTPFDDGGKGPEIKAILDCVHREGALSADHAQELMGFLQTESWSLHALVAYVVGESQGDDEELCEAFSGFRPDTMQALFAHMALLKKDIRDKSNAERVDAFRGLFRSEDGVFQLEVAKEIARIDPEQGKVILEELAKTSDDFLVQSEAARVLHDMGGPDLGAVRLRHMGMDTYTGILTTLAGKNLWENDLFPRPFVEQFPAVLQEVRERENFSEEQIAKLLQPFGKHSQLGPLTRGVTYGEIKGEYPSLHAKLKNDIPTLRRTRIEYAFVRLGLVKSSAQDQSATQKVAVLLPLTEDENPYLRAEAAKEIARVHPKKGKDLLKRLLDSDEHVVVRGESARMLDKMGEKTELGAAYRHMYHHDYTGILRIIEAEPLWTSAGDGELRMAAGLMHMRKPGEPRHLPFSR